MTMCPDIALRRLVASEAATYRALAIAGYGAHPDAFTASVDERVGLPLAWWEARVGDEFVVGAWSGDALVGVAGLARATRPKTRHKATLFGMFVDPRHARRGIGERLAQAVLDHAATLSALRVVQLTVTEGNRSAEALYARCGFIAFGVEPYAIAVDDGHRAKVHMWIDLAARGAAAASREAAHA